MRLIVTLVGGGPRRPGDGAALRLDVEIEAPEAAVLGDVSALLCAAAGAPGAAVFAGSNRLRPDAPLGSGPLRSGAVLGIGTPSARGVLGTTAVELRVVGGPAAGGITALRPGAVVIGRDHTADVEIDDPDVSRRHLTMHIGTDQITVTDLRSTNGSTLDRAPLEPEVETVLVSGALVRAGCTLLQVVGADDPPAALHERPDGAVAVRRPPRLPAPHNPPVVVFPAEPASRMPAALPVVGSLAPIGIGLALAIWTHSAGYLLFTLLSPLMLVGNAWSDRRGVRKGRRSDRARYAADLARAEDLLALALTAETLARRAENPDAAAIHHIAVLPGQRLWERRRTDPDVLVLRLGTADLPSRLRVDRGSGDAHPRLAAVPAAVSLVECGVLGVAGPTGPATALMRSLVAQLAVLHSPDDLSIVLLGGSRPGGSTGSDGGWSWSRWFPHIVAGTPSGRSLAVAVTDTQRGHRIEELRRLVDDRNERRPSTSGWAGPRTVVVVDAGAARHEPMLEHVLREGPAVGVHALCVETSATLLPAACDAVAVITGETGSELVLHRSGAEPIDRIALDAIDAQLAERIARALAPLRDVGTEPDGGVPVESRLADLLDEALGERPRAAGRSARFVIGETAGGPLVLDLARDGPHALVAGTTGAGKSELLQTMVVSLAAVNSPESLAFVLVDYKGGAAFRSVARLPHTAGLVTDLDPHLTERAITSLTAELRRREAVLAAAGAASIDELWQRGDGDDVPLPRLVLVVDEFATLVDELPDFVEGLVGIAMRGRSLGIHLILATQRPGGVVSPVIRANTNLRIALRVTDAAESTDVLDRPDAARIGVDTPGRALMRTGAHPPVLFQTARVGAPPRSATTVSVRPVPWHLVGAPEAAVPPVPAGSDLSVLVDEIAAACGAPAQSPWLPPLPAVVTLDELPTETDAAAASVAFAVADRPAEQRRTPCRLDLGAGAGLLVVGSPRSGRTTTLRTIGAAAARRFRPDELHLYVFDCAGGGLRSLTSLPHCGAYCDRDDIDRGDRLLRRLADELTRRQAELAAAGWTSIAEQRAGAAAGARLSLQLLLVDGWEGFTATYDVIDSGRASETMQRLIREGPAAGLSVVVAGDRGTLLARIPSALPMRMALRLADRGDYPLLGIRARQVPVDIPDGRGLLADDATEVQVAVLGADVSGAAQGAAVRASGRRCPEPAPGQGPIRMRALPDRVPAASLPRSSRPLRVVVGLGGDDAEPVSLDLDTDGPALLVAGPPGSGRSAALHHIARRLRSAGTPVTVIASARSPLAAFTAATAERSSPTAVLAPGNIDGIRSAIDGLSPGGRRFAVVVDDLEQLDDLPAGGLLADLLAGMARTDARAGVLVAAARTDDLARSFRGPGPALLRLGTGLLLQPSGTDGELFGVRLPRRPPAMLPGRGVLVVRRRVTAVQVALDPF